MRTIMQRALLAALVVVGLAAGLSRVSPAHAEWVWVGVEEPSFDPATWGYAPGTLWVAAGDTVTWFNNGRAPHTVTAYDGSFDSGIFLGGENWTLTPWTPGEYVYYCTLHPQMVATLIVY